MTDLLSTAGQTAPKQGPVGTPAPKPDTRRPAGANAMHRLVQRIFPPLSKEQAELLASVKFPCC